jgi:pimeloyl-ACP methyl ester carboxylesterase
MICGYAYDRNATARDRKNNPPRGQLVDVGGYRLHLYCIGSGQPTVLLDAGGFDSLEQWKSVQPQVAAFTRVCSYDRPGFGWSDASPNPQTAKQIAAELHAALNRAGITGPFVVVGHSIAGLYVRLFAAEFPGEVVGMLLDDSVHPVEFDQFPAHFPNHPFLFGALRLTAPFGVPRLIHSCKQSAAKPDCARFVQTLLKGLDDVKTSYLQARNLGPLNVPLIVLAHDPDIGLDKRKRDQELETAWSKWQQDLAGLSATSQLIVVKGCGHEIQTDNPGMVTDAIRQLLGSARRIPVMKND